MAPNGTTPPSTPWRVALRQLFGIGEQDIVPDADRRKNTLTFAVIGLAILALWGVLNRTWHQDDARLHLLGLFQLLLVAFLMLPAVWFAIWGRRPLWSESLLVLAGFVVFAINNVFGGQAGDALYWSFVYPYLVFFLRGQKVGWLVGLLFAATVPPLLVYSSAHWGLWTYRPLECLFYGVAYTFNVLTAAHFNVLRSVFQQRLWEQVGFHTGEVRRHLESLRHNATHDLGTGLPNRTGLVERVQAHCDTSGAAPNGHLHVVSIRFFRVPEVSSIVTPDRVDGALSALAQWLQAHTPGLLALGRTRHDDLALVLHTHTTGTEGLSAAMAMDNLPPGGLSSGLSVHEEWACGVAVEPLRADLDPADVLRRSEQALLYAVTHRLRCRFYDQELDGYFVKRNRRYEKVRVAIDNDQLALHYQPQVDLRTGRLVGAEALVRWNDPEEGFIAPDEFIPIIESTGLLHRFSLWTIERAMRDCAAWQPQLPGVTVAINLSADVLHDPQVVEALRTGLAHNGLVPGLVVVELTESVMLNAPDKAIGVMRQIVDMGVHLSIDDYGAGFSSLTYVKQLPAQELKIDKSFVSGMPHNAQDRAIVQSSVDLAHDFGLKVLAEGIEDADTVRLLQQAGCDLGQGWYYARALPLDRFMDWSPPAHLAHTPPPTH